jgi:hypothetical protein
MRITQPSELQSFINQIAAITTMERGKLSEEYRTRPASTGKGTIRLGPYYKLQAWEQGHNVSRRVPVDEVPALKEQLANFERFNELTNTLAEEIITRTRVQRRSASNNTEALAASAKKNSTKKPAAKGIAKRKPSSRKPKRA